MSFETPNSPIIFHENWQPEVDLQIGNKVRQIKGADHEVALHITLTVKIGERTAYLVEVHQAGIFEARGFGTDELADVLGGYCPQVLYPYLRETVSDIVSRGGFPPFIMAPINFELMFAQHKEKLKNAAGSKESSH
jgi:preprotein translocase subunit SecB